VSSRAEVMAAQQKVITVAADIIATERHLGDDDRAALMLATLDEALAYAMRDAVNAISESPPEERPPEWDLSPGGDTA
jgi:hypothetical protein